MTKILLALLLMTTHASAGWLRRFCEGRLVVENPYPHAEFTNGELADSYRYSDKKGALAKELEAEIRYRLANTKLTMSDSLLLWVVLIEGEASEKD